MAETKQIGSICIVTDSETSYQNIGDVEGGFDDIQLKDHIQKHGHAGLLNSLAYMQWQVWNTVRTVNSEKDFEDACGC